MSSLATRVPVGRVHRTGFDDLPAVVLQQIGFQLADRKRKQAWLVHYSSDWNADLGELLNFASVNKKCRTAVGAVFNRIQVKIDSLAQARSLLAHPFLLSHIR